MGTIDHLLDAPDLRYAWADATNPTSRYFQRNYRNILWISDTILILDDLRSWDIGQFEWLLHYQGEARRRGKTVEIREEGVGVDVTPLFPATLPEGGLPTDYPEAMRLVTHDGLADADPKVKQPYLGFQPAGKSEREKFLVALQPREDGKAPSSTERLEGLDWIGARITATDRVTEVYMNLLADGRIRHRNANATIAGFETDAYIVALSWPAAEWASKRNPEQITVIDGSYVRRKGDVIMDSLTKITAHLRMGDTVAATIASPYRTVTIQCRSRLMVQDIATPLSCSNGQAVVRDLSATRR
jgi:hypothetical protein